MPFKEYFSQKRVLVTGAGRGIGRAVAKRLYGYGSVVFALARTEENLKSLKEECPNISTICVDLADWTATRDAVSKIGPIELLVNNAAVLVFETFMDISPDVFDNMMSVNVKAQINLGQIVAQSMMDENIKGSIVNVSSDSSVVVAPGIGVYGVTKAALDMLTKVMAVELGPKKIRVNSVNPGGVPTDMLEDYYESLATHLGITIEEFKQTRIDKCPLGASEMEMSNIVNAILFMLSDICPFIHGESLFIEGAKRHT